MIGDAAKNDALQLLVAIGATLLGTSLASLLLRSRKFAMGQLLLGIGVLIAAFFTITSGTSRVARLGAVVKPPKLILYGSVAFGLAALVLIYSEHRRDRCLKARLLELHTSLLDFAGEIALRETEIKGSRCSESEEAEHHKWVATEFDRRYSTRLIELFRALIRFRWFDAKTALNLLQLPFREESPLYVGRTKIGIIAGFINRIADRPALPGEWLTRWSAWGNLFLCLICSAGMWFALDFLAKHWPMT